MKLGIIISVLFISFSNLLYGGEIWVAGKNHNIIEVVQATNLIKDANGTVVFNPFSGKTVSMRFIPGKIWTNNKVLATKFWNLSRAYFHFGFPSESFRPIYAIEDNTLIIKERTKYGELGFKWYFHEFNVHPERAAPDIAPQIFKNIIEALDMQIKNVRLVCLEMTGTFDLQDAHQDSNVQNIGQTSYRFEFRPQSAKILGFVDAVSGEIVAH